MSGLLNDQPGSGLYYGVVSRGHANVFIEFNSGYYRGMWGWGNYKGQLVALARVL